MTGEVAVVDCFSQHGLVMATFRNPFPQGSQSGLAGRYWQSTLPFRMGCAPADVWHFPVSVPVGSHSATKIDTKLMSLSMNGLWFIYSHGVTHLLNIGSVDAAMKKIKAGNTSGGVVMRGLTLRRADEVKLYREGQYEMNGHSLPSH